MGATSGIWKGRSAAPATFWVVRNNAKTEASSKNNRSMNSQRRELCVNSRKSDRAAGRANHRKPNSCTDPGVEGTQEHPARTIGYTELAPVRHHRTLRPCPAPVEKFHVQVPGLPFQDASIRTVYAPCPWSDCFGMRQITPNWPNSVIQRNTLYRKLPGRFLPRSGKLFSSIVLLKHGEDCEWASSRQLNSESSLKWKTVRKTKLRIACEVSGAFTPRS